jgi:hypothetical protein
MQRSYGGIGRGLDITLRSAADREHMAQDAALGRPADLDFYRWRITTLCIIGHQGTCAGPVR